ncbi:MAG: bifunctional diguanylate cyclase/phosphodiesterase [Mobilitalea sp.]
MKYILTKIIGIILFLLYIMAIVNHLVILGDLLSLVLTFFMFLLISRTYYRDVDRRYSRSAGFFLSLGFGTWAASDIAWTISDAFLSSAANENILYIYDMTSLFFLIAISIYGLHIMRKWNRVQGLLDVVVITFLVLELIWIILFNESMDSIYRLQSDWRAAILFIADLIMVIEIVIWFLSIRNGKLQLYIRFASAGVLMYALIDLVYYFAKYSYIEVNSSYLDILYVFSFGIIGVGGLLREKMKDTNIEVPNDNVGRKGKSVLLLGAPLLLIIFKGFEVEYLLECVSIIMIYSMIAYYIQKNIYKEGLLYKEKELNIVLEHKVQERTEELSKQNIRLECLLNQDGVTGLYNRRYLLTFLEQAITSLKPKETILLLSIDVNRFKMITTMFGHHIGEIILLEMAEKLSPLIRPGKESILAAYSEDTFVFAIKGQYNYSDGYETAYRAIELCSDIYWIEEYRINITVNVGISILPVDAQTKEELIKHADIAMVQSKEYGCNLVQEFDAKLSEVIFRKNTIEIMLKRVEFKQEFMMYFQPQVNTRMGGLIGFEALLRWKTSTGEFISPGEFIPIAEETGYIVPIGEWVMKTSLLQLAQWNKINKNKIMMGINVSLKQLNSDQFFIHLVTLIEELSLNPKWIDIEITESIQLQDNPDIMKVLEDMRELGITISIDDFGTGYSSLSYLKDLPVDRIKIAKELIDQITIDDFGYQLVKSIIMIAHVRGIRVIAEGVEKEEQWVALSQLLCDEIQGYFFGRPMSVEDMWKLYGDVLK